MPLPDANKRSPRVYTNLQNLNLDDVTFANVQSTGNPINVEEVNEDELRRLVLVNLARLVCAGEWNGLLTTAASTQYALEPIDASQLTTYNNFVPWARNRTFTDSVSSSTMEDKAVFTRFIAPLDGTMGLITVRTNATNTGKDDCKMAIYSSTNGLPGTLLGSVSIDVNGGAALFTSDSWSSAPELTAGETYWIAVAPEGGTKPAISGGAVALYLELGFTHYAGTGYTSLYNDGGTNYDFPATVTDSYLIGSNTFTPVIWSFKYA